MLQFDTILKTCIYLFEIKEWRNALKVGIVMN